MHDELLSHYQRELNYLQQLLSEYAQHYPKIAGRLRLSDRGSDDPQVGRLLEAAAFLNASLQYKLADDFSEISEALLNVLAPHFLAPVPALSIAQFQPDAEILQGRKMIAKNTLLQLETVTEEQAYHFTTCYPVELWPIGVSHAELTGLPLQTPVLVKKYPHLLSTLAHEIKSSLVLRLSCLKPSLAWSELALEKLTFHLNAEAPVCYRLYELLQQTAFIVLADSRDDPEPLILEKDVLHWLGFDENEGLLPYTNRVKMPYRLLMDYAILPEKFLFFSITKLQAALQKKFKQAGQQLEIYFMLRQENPSLEKKLNADYFKLGCTPIINLFAHRAEPILPEGTSKKFRVAASGKPAHMQEIYSIERVMAYHENHAAVELPVFNSLQKKNPSANSIFYEAKRVPAWQADYYDEKGTEVLLSFVDIHYNSVDLDGWQIKADIYMTNRDGANQLIKSTASEQLTFAEKKEATVASINYLKSFTPTRRPFLQTGACWQYISHLLPNYLTLTSNEAGIAAFRALLMIYNFDEQAALKKQLEGLEKINAKQITARNPRKNPSTPFMQGIEIILQANTHFFEHTSLFLLGSILERFLSLYATSQSFTQLVINNSAGECYRWPIRLGEQPLF